MQTPFYVIIEPIKRILLSLRSDASMTFFLDKTLDVVYFKWYEERQLVGAECAGGLLMTHCRSFVVDLAKVTGLDMTDGNCIGRG